MVKIVTKRPRGNRSWNSEQGLISAIINEADHLIFVERGVSADWFHLHKDEWMFIEEYVKSNRQTPSETLFKRKFPSFEVIKVYDIEELIGEVKSEHVRYELLDHMEGIAEALQSDMATDKVLHKAEKGLIGLRSQIDGTTNQTDVVHDWRETFDEVKARSIKARRSGGIPGIPSGWPSLDDVSGGFGGGEYWVVASRLGHGKTWTLVQWACNAVVNGYKAQYHAMEQGRTQIHMRAHNLLSSRYARKIFAAHDLRMGKGVDLAAYRMFQQELKRNLSGHFWVDDTPRGRVTPVSISAAIERNQPDIVFIDYLGLMNKSKGDWGAMAALSADLKGMSIAYGVPIVAAAQLNRTGEGKEPPGPNALSESDAIGHDADGLVTMASQSLRCKKYRLAKFRHGPDGMKWFCRLDLRDGVFIEITGDEAADVIDEDEA